MYAKTYQGINMPASTGFSKRVKSPLKFTIYGEGSSLGA